MDIIAKIKENILLAPMTTFKIGGQAKYFVEISSKEELEEIFNWVEIKKEKFVILGGGSNILISDQGFNGLVIKLNNKKIKAKGVRIESGSGAELPKVLSEATGNNLAGLEWAAGIPGSMAGAVRGNAGAFGNAISDVVETTEAYNTKDKRFINLSKSDCEFNYRTSIFKTNPNLIIWQIDLKLNIGDKIDIEEVISQNLLHRNNTQPKLPSAGCVFKNLTIEELRNFNPELALEVEKEGLVKGGKIGSGWFIDQAGLKGKTIGGAKISLEHANFIVNTGKATAEDVVMLISFIKQQIRTKFKIQLAEEIQLIGF